MSVLIKRKRGRPRLDESREINDFDISLVEAVKKYPIFYNKNHPHYRNRESTEHVWELVANSLNVSVTVVKNRMLQLRNRYNVEKRRVEISRKPTSNWPLFDNLQFISEFNTNRLLCNLNNTNLTNNAAHASSSSDAEENDEDEEDGEDLETEKSENIANQRNGYITSDKIDTNHQPDLLQSPQIDSEEFDFDIPEGTEKGSENDGHTKKFQAFGQFLASSLFELNEMQALHLVKKFTADLVEYSKLGEGKKVLRTSMKQHSSICGDEEVQLN